VIFFIIPVDVSSKLFPPLLERCMLLLEVKAMDSFLAFILFNLSSEVQIILCFVD